MWCRQCCLCMFINFFCVIAERARGTSVVANLLLFGKSMTLKTPPPLIFSSSFFTHRCISPTQHLLSRVPSHQILEPRSLKASTVFSSLPVWNAVAAVVCSIRNCSFAKTQLYRNWNDQRIFLCTSNKSSLAQKVLNQPSSFLLK